MSIFLSANKLLISNCLPTDSMLFTLSEAAFTELRGREDLSASPRGPSIREELLGS